MIKIIGKDNAKNTEVELMDIVNHYNESLFNNKAKVKNIMWNNRITRTVGRYTYDTQTIELSKKHHKINDKNELANTIIHEMIHAYLGKGEGHGSKFQLECIRINELTDLNIGTRTATESAKFLETRRSTKTYLIECTECMAQFERKRDMTKKYKCGCGGRLVIDDIMYE